MSSLKCVDLQVLMLLWKKSISNYSLSLFNNAGTKISELEVSIDSQR